MRSRPLLEIQVGLYVDSELLREFPRSLAEEYQVVPLRRLGKGVLLGIQGEPPAALVRDLSIRLGKPVCFIPCHLPELGPVLNRLYAHCTPGRRIGEILRDDQQLSEPELNSALQRQQLEAPRRLGEILLELGLVSRHELTVGLTSQERERNPALNSAVYADPKAVEKIPESLARRYRVLPLTVIGGELVVASEQVFDDSVLAELQSAAGLPIRRALVGSGEVTEALEQVYGRFRRTRLKELRLGELLIEEGLIDQQQLDICLKDQKVTHRKLGQILIERGFVTEDAVFRTLAGKLGVEFRRFTPAEIDLELGHFLSPRFAEQNQVLMLSKDEQKRQVIVAMADPADLNLRDIIQGIVSQHHYQVVPVLSPPSCIEAGIVYCYSAHETLPSETELTPVRVQESEDLSATDRMPEIKRIINQILLTAVTEGASDIHIENLEEAVHVRFRVDGVLEDRKTPVTKENIANVISVLKVDSGLDIAERRRSQDGVFKKRVGRDRFIDFRINVHATPFGEDAVIRILDRQKNLLPLEKLGFSDKTLETYLRLIANPQGLILFTGPTGSGKTTTLYSTLTYLNTGNRKIVTAEDPIEYVLSGISQYQVNEAIGNTFDDYARRFLRKDPDIILIGEIRDAKTARACVNAAMTGHLVFSTLHTNDAFGVVRRLYNLEISPALVADSLLLVVAQRLARRICPQCQEPGEPDPKLLRDFYPRGVPDGIRFLKAAGCPACRHKGYRGRIGLYEFWEVNARTRQMIAAGASEEEIRKAAVQDGARVLLHDALSKVAAGVTTLEELSRVVPIDQLQRYARLSEVQAEG